jgi:glycosyltransferase involved in cell wall biosynthesis
VVVNNEDEFVGRAVELLTSQESYSELINSLSDFRVEELMWGNIVRRVVNIYEGVLV